jgi:hypothetical protein
VKIRQLASGIASGYVAKAVQFVASIALVPFYLRDDILGLEGYGLAFTILAATQFLTLFTNGLRLAFTRTVAQAVAGGAGHGPTPGEALGSGTKILLGLCALLGAGIVLATGSVLALLGIEPGPDARRALWLASALFVVENGLQLLRAPLMTRGAISFVNLWLAVESLLRALAMFVLLSAYGGSLTLYFAVYLALTTLRQIVFYARLRIQWPDDLVGSLRAPLVHGLPAIRYSLAVSLHWGANLLVARTPIVLANRFLGAEVSGLVAIVINTIRGYFQQMLFSVLQPISVPVGALVDPRRLSQSARRTLFDLEAVYVLGVGVVITSAAAVMPTLLRLWLGEAYVGLALPSQLVLIGSAVELAFTVRRSLLLGQGLLLPAAWRFAAVGAIAVAAAAVCAIPFQSWQGMVAVVGAFLVVGNAWGIGVAFRQTFGEFSGPSWGRAALFLLLTGAVAIGLSRSVASRGFAGAAIALGANGVVALVVAQFLLVPLRRGIETLLKLRRSADRDLLGAAESEVTAS